MTVIKKRGKANPKVTVEDAMPTLTEIIQSPVNLPSNLILQLKKVPKTLNEASFSEGDILAYDPNITTPNAYDPVDSLSVTYSYVDSSTAKKSEKKPDKPVVDEWCWWCCHKYSTKTLGMPIRKNTDGSYQCIGNFCSPECICAYIMDSGHRYGDRWKELELLHEMLKVTDRINPAPKRELLNVFGGELSINEFRGNTKWNLIYPPMVSLKMQMDDTPVEKNDEENPMFSNSSNTLKISNLNLDTIDEIVPRKKQTKVASVNGSLDRFWGSD